MKTIETILENTPQTTLSKLTELKNLFEKIAAKKSLVSREDRNHIWERHIVDSLTPRFWIEQSEFETGIDYGSGNGFPVIPLCILYPEKKFWAIEIQTTKADIIRYLKRELQIKNLEVIDSDIYNMLGTMKTNFFISRGVSEFEQDFEVAKSFLKPEGLFITFKGQNFVTPPNTDNLRLLEYSVVPDRVYKLIGAQV